MTASFRYLLCVIADPPEPEKLEHTFIIFLITPIERKRSIGSYLLSVIRYYKKYETPFYISINGEI
jgi:hypothetical protein